MDKDIRRTRDRLKRLAQKELTDGTRAVRAKLQALEMELDRLESRHKITLETIRLTEIGENDNG